MNSFSYLESVCCSMSSSNCCFLTCIQISQEADRVVWYSHLFQNFPVYCDPQSKALNVRIPTFICSVALAASVTLESPLDFKEIQPVNPKGNQPWIFIGRTDVEVEATLLWPLDAKSQPIGKDPDAEKDGGQEEKGVIEDEMVGWHHWLSGHEFEQTSGDSEGQESLVCCSPQGCKE